VPIPGSRKVERIEENLGAADIDLTDEEFGRIEAELAKIEIHGNRTGETSLSSTTSTDATGHQRASLVDGLHTCCQSGITPSTHLGLKHEVGH
jgi:hypothetical protein